MALLKSLKQYCSIGHSIANLVLPVSIELAAVTLISRKIINICNRSQVQACPGATSMHFSLIIIKFSEYGI